MMDKLRNPIAMLVSVLRNLIAMLASVGASLPW
jgi:hypothetical protein